MHLTRQSQIAVAVLLACARAQGRYVHTYEASAGTGASRLYAAKIGHLLVRHRLAVSSRGRNGGIRLARPANEISLGAVLRLTQPELAGTPGHGALGAGAVTLASVIEAGWSGFVHLMDSFTIADLAAESAAKLACPVRHAPAPHHNGDAARQM